MSDGVKRTIVFYDPRFNIGWTGTEQVLDYVGDNVAAANGTTALLTGAEATNGVDQSAKDYGSAVVRTPDISGRVAATAAYFRSIEEPIDVETPTVLLGISATFNKSAGESTSSYPATQQGFFFLGNGSGSLNPRASAHTTASVQPVVNANFRRYPKRLVARRYEFFINGNVSEAAILAKITLNVAGHPIVNSWPIIVEQSESFALQGQSVSASANAETQVTGFTTSPTGYGFSFSYGKGTGKEGSTNTSFFQLPWCIHGPINISPSEDTADAVAAAVANSIEISLLGGVAVSAITNETGTITKTATGSISPSSLGATVPAALPTSGLYLYDWKSDNTVGYGDTFITAWVIDAANFA